MTRTRLARRASDEEKAWITCQARARLPKVPLRTTFKLEVCVSSLFSLPRAPPEPPRLMFGAAKSPSLLGGAMGESAGDTMMGMSLAGSDIAKNPCPCCTLTYMQRFYGFISCFGIGMLLSFLSTTQLWTGDLRGFSLLYTFGNIVAILSTGFLMGACVRDACCARAGARVALLFTQRSARLSPLASARPLLRFPARSLSRNAVSPTAAGPVAQCKAMFHKNRVVATSIYLFMLIITLVVAIAYNGAGKTVLVVICVILQLLALIWYAPHKILLSTPRRKRILTRPHAAESPRRTRTLHARLQVHAELHSVRKRRGAKHVQVVLGDGVRGKQNFSRAQPTRAHA